MTTTIRRIAVSGSAAVALLGGAAAITVVDAPHASAAETHTVVERAVTAPVNLPDGRTIRITGMGGYGHRATEAHVATVAAWQPGTNPSGTTQLQTPYTTGQTPADYQQIQAQASGGTIAVGIVSIIILGIIVFYKVKHGGLKIADAFLGVVAGVAVGGTFLGPMISGMTNSLVGSLGGVIGGLG